MVTPNNNNMTLEEAMKMLKAYSCTEPKKIETEEDRKQLRQAIRLITNLSEYENLGVCADNAQQGFQALSNYLKALGYTVNFNLDNEPRIQKPVYIKYNTQKQTHYLHPYTGSYRGILISCQSEDDQIVGTYGHFPLDLFD